MRFHCIKSLYKEIPLYDTFTHLQALEISMKFLLQMASDIRIVWKFYNSIFSLEMRNKNVTQIFF